MLSKDLIVVGGGIAGLSAIHYLAAEGRACLLERENVLGAHSSGRNAAIYRPLEDDATTGWLSKRSMAAWDKLLEHAVVKKSGLLLVSSERSRVDELISRAVTHHVNHQTLYDRDSLCRVVASLEKGNASTGVLVPEGGVLDIHAMLTALESSAKKRRAEIRTGSEVRRVVVTSDRVQGVELTDGTRIHAPVVVIAAGAWAGGLGQSCNAAMPLVPLRRHLVQLAPTQPLACDHPIVWRLEEEVYFRPESGGVLASPCDEEVHAPAEPATDPRALEQLATKLTTLAPRLSSAAVRRSWACLRTFAPDRELIAGADPRVQGLYWLGALGGRGMSVAVAVGELVADVIAGRPHHLAEHLSPSRLMK